MPTQEAIDPVRYITNHSSGKMGYAIAKMAMLRGADVTLVSGRTALAPPPFVKVVPVVTARDMYEAVTSVSQEQDIIIKAAAAVADYRPASVSDEKIKKKDDDMSIALERTDDILKYLGEHKPDGTVSLWLFHGNREYDRQFQSQTYQEKSGYGSCQQCKNGRCRIPGGHQCSDSDYTG